MKKVLIGLVVVLVLGAVGAAGVWYFLEQRLTTFAQTAFGAATPVVVEIPPGTNPKGVATLLAKAQVVSDADLLYGWLRREKLGPKLKAGEYEFVGPLTPPQAVEKLIKGEVKVYRFTVPEGLRWDEILPIVASSELKLELEKLKALAADKAFLKRAGVPATSIEGFLFPDTYTFPRGVSEEQVLRKMVESTLEAVKKAPRRQGVTLDLLQAVTLASIVEKETGAVEERPRISCVFHNRMNHPDGETKGKLETDPTVIYAKMLRTGVYSKNITREDLLTPHPYNTYKIKGLPPGPIASPGGAAIAAALNPLDCPDYFFVSKNDGTHIFCPDYACHEAQVKKWQVEYFKHK
ncbi:MAG: endolytic transglycosylase MltG [Myxococcaceae bacterium]|nr:endolytic transglycosylase MltG [Myxococcaceae bacterium]